jgi:hypothetical protein
MVERYLYSRNPFAGDPAFSPDAAIADPVPESVDGINR